MVQDYERFARSFTQIRAADIRAQVEAIYASRRFWPEPLVSINPNFERDIAIDTLVADGSLHPSTGQVFRIADQPITLYRHQSQALAKASARQSFVVTTGTGSGKSLCFFVPIIDLAIRARLAGEAPRTRAIVIYPMNALANSQIEELRKFVNQSDLPERLRPTFERYTGQEGADERERIRELCPDILLTNFMMLELLMTRQNSLDQAVISNAKDLDFIVLDELHTYRGRQGADVAMLVRRLRDRLCRDRVPICIGTSATMASDDATNDPAAAVAIVASRLFGTQITSDAVIGESLERATDPAMNVKSLGGKLGAAIDDEIPVSLSDAELRSHPLAVWIELEIGLEDGQRLRRHPPITLKGAAQKLAAQTGRDPERCQSQIQAMLILMNKPASERGGTSDRAFMAFKLHQFFCGAGRLYSTLREPTRRRVTLDGQLFDPEEKETRLYPTFFCRNCGQEHHPIVLSDQDGRRRALPRPIDEPPLDNEDRAEQAGYLMPEPLADTEFTFDGTPEQYPDDWIDPAGRIKSNLRPFAPQPVVIDESGVIGMRGRKAWFLPGKFRFCPACKDQPAGQAREINKLAGLSAEGRSSATTLLVSSTLRWMNAPSSGFRIDKRKVLGFTDNRQDAALQAGHFNDFLFVAQLRAAILAAVIAAGPDGLADDEFGRKIQAALGFTAANRSRRSEWMLDPEIKGAGQVAAERTLSRVFAYRVWADQRRGWRFTNPNLEELGLVHAEYLSLDDLAADDNAFVEAPPELKHADPATRRQALFILLETMRRGLAVTADALDPTTVEATANAARQSLREPWSISHQENQRSASALIVDAPKKADAGLRGEPLILRAGPRSSLARRLGHPTLWKKRLDGKTYLTVLKSLLAAAADYQLVRSVTTSFDVDGWRLAANAIRLVSGEGRNDSKAPNPYFVDLYRALAKTLSEGGAGLFGLESRAHTAQVEQTQRQWREWRFRWGDDDKLKIAEAKDDMRQAGEPDVFLPALFCSPTMELGVDISALNAVYLRNVPPTPANYAQRSGRAGRSGQAALVITYCAAQSPHDQYYFEKPERMVNGYVRLPAIELANRDLIEAHLHAVWLAETGKELSADIPHVLDLADEALPVQKDITMALGNSEVSTRAVKRMERILTSISTELTPQAAPWALDREVHQNLPEIPLLLEVMRKRANERVAAAADLPAEENAELTTGREEFKTAQSEWMRLDGERIRVETAIPIEERVLSEIQGELPALSFSKTEAESPICPVCEVPIDRVLAEGCKLSHKIPDIAACQRRWAQRQADFQQQSKRLQNLGRERTQLIQQTAHAKQKLDPLANSVLAIEKARDFRGAAWYSARRLQDDIEQLSDRISAQDSATKTPRELATKIEAERVRLTAFRDEQARAFGRLSQKFDSIVRRLLGQDAKGSIVLSGAGIELSIDLGGDRATAAIDSLKVLAFDLAALCLSIEGATRVPAFLLHDSPREADLGLSIYYELFRMVRELEGSAEHPLFQYIVTTTTEPPDTFKTDPRLRLVIRGAPAEERLLRMNL